MLLTHATGTVTADQEARLIDTLDELNTKLQPYGLNLVVLDGQTQADATLHAEIAATSPCGDAAAGILGCTSGPGEITILDGWDWYSGADMAGINFGQFDFQTVLTHELGHAVGMSHSGDELSVMYGWLAGGDTRRDLTNDDLSLLGGGGGGGPLRARPRQNVGVHIPAVWLPSKAISYADRDEEETANEAVDKVFEAEAATSNDWLLLLLKQRARDGKSDNVGVTHSPDASGLFNGSHSITDAVHEPWNSDLDAFMSQLET